MIAEISSEAFDSFFAWAPLVVGIIIYAAFYVAKRHEKPTTVAASRTTYACAVCGRRGALDQMVPHDHGGAIGYVCSHCAAVSQPAH